MKTVNIHAAKTHLSSLVEEAALLTADPAMSAYDIRTIDASE
jgi:hypothetical protein